MGCTPSVLNHSVQKKYSLSSKRTNSFIKKKNSKSSKTNSQYNSSYDKSYLNKSNQNSISKDNEKIYSLKLCETDLLNKQENTNNHISQLINNNKILRNEISHLEIIITKIVISKYNLIQKHNLDIKKKKKINTNLTKSLLKYKNMNT